MEILAIVRHYNHSQKMYFIVYTFFKINYTRGREKNIKILSKKRGIEISSWIVFFSDEVVSVFLVVVYMFVFPTGKYSMAASCHVQMDNG